MAPGRGGFTVYVGDLLRRPGSRLVVREEVPVDGVAVVDSAVPEGTLAQVELELESLSNGLTATGHVRAPWEGTCRRCLEQAHGWLDVAVRELFQPAGAAIDEEAFPIEGEHIDLVPLARDALMLDLPLAPLCRPDCRGLCPTCGIDLNEAPPDHGHEPVDPRWAGLAGLRFDEPGEDRPD